MFIFFLDFIESSSSHSGVVKGGIREGGVAGLVAELGCWMPYSSLMGAAVRGV